MVANSHSKSTLRSVAAEVGDEARRNLLMTVDYFPSFELATLNPREQVWQERNVHGEPDGRHVRRVFIDDVIIRLFLDRYLAPAG